MSLISYAQNYEDIMLWRALKHINCGFYIDVGANDPEADSVTKLFYDKGWHGINIEPLKIHYADLLAERPNDINLLCAAGSQAGDIDIWSCDIRGWATASSTVTAQHEANGVSGTYQKVPVLRLQDICAQYVSGDIHFLKIDVEGFEGQVISGMDFSRFRPWILVVETTQPNSDGNEGNQWESILFRFDYSHVYSDGLNRYYLANERIDLKGAFRYPPNVFDQFIRYAQYVAEARCLAAEDLASRLQKDVSQAEDHLRLMDLKVRRSVAHASRMEAMGQRAVLKAKLIEVELGQKNDLINALLHSISWRITAPLRLGGKVVRRLRRHLFQNPFGVYVKRILRNLIGNIGRFVYRFAPIKKIVSVLLAATPVFRARLHYLLWGGVGSSSFRNSLDVTKINSRSLANIPLPARLVYRDLKQKIIRKGS